MIAGSASAVGLRWHLMATFEKGGRFNDAKEFVRLVSAEAFPDAEVWQALVRLAPNTEDRAFI